MGFNKVEFGLNSNTSSYPNPKPREKNFPQNFTEKADASINNFDSVRLNSNTNSYPNPNTI
jgi:hypothetical protein